MSGPRQVTLVVQHALHHGKMSGYHRLAEYLVARGVGRVATHRFPRRGTWRLAEPFARRSGLAWYGPEPFLTEVWAVATTWGGGLVHFLQGENAYRYAAHVPGSRRLVATLHLPPSVFGEYVRGMRHLERLDAVIFLAHNQFALLDRLRARPAAYLIPHGIDTDFYLPAPQPAATATCLFVGSFLRDFAMLEGVISAVRRRAPEVRFRLVVLPEAAARWQGRPGVEACSGLDDEALRRAYQEAALLVMPLRDCAANNAILEAMACGLPIVTTEVGGIRSYVDETCARLVLPGDIPAMAQAVLDLLGDTDARSAMGRAGRRRTDAFAWPEVARRVMAVYEGLR